MQSIILFFVVVVVVYFCVFNCEIPKCRKVCNQTALQLRDLDLHGTSSVDSCCIVEACAFHIRTAAIDQM